MIFYFLYLFYKELLLVPKEYFTSQDVSTSPFIFFFFFHVLKSNGNLLLFQVELVLVEKVEEEGLIQNSEENQSENPPQTPVEPKPKYALKPKQKPSMKDLMASAYHLK